MSTPGLERTPKRVEFVTKVLKERWEFLQERDRFYLQFGMPPSDPPDKMYWASTIVGAMRKDKSKRSQRIYAIMNTPWIWRLAAEIGVSFEPLKIDRNRLKFISLQQPSQEDLPPPKKMVAINWDGKTNRWPIEKQIAWAMEPVDRDTSSKTTHLEKKTSKARDEEYGSS